MDEFTEVTSSGWFSRITDSIKAVLVGLLLFVLAFPLLWFNEGRAVSAAKSLDEGASSVVSVSADKVDAANEGKLVHTTGVARTEDVLKDSDFGISMKTIKLTRSVEMYQWTEKKKTEKQKKIGGGEEKTTVHRYTKAWSSKTIDSSDFRKPKGHHNPTMAYEGYTKRAQTVSLGAFTLADSVAKKIAGASLLSPDAQALEAVTPSLRERTQLRDGAFYVTGGGKKVGDGPLIGDLRVRFKVVQAAEISVAAKQVGSSLETWQSKTGNTIELVEMGTKAAEAMFANAKTAAATLTWILRLVGLLMMAFGVGLVFRPLVVVADVVPFVGEMLRIGTFFVSAAIAVPLSILTIALAWIAARPLIGGGFLLLFVGSVVGLVLLIRKRKAARTAAPAATTSP